MKSILPLVVGLVIGGAGGVWYGGHHPEAAATEDRSVTKAQLDVAQTAVSQLDKEIDSRAGKPNNSGLVSTDSLKNLRTDEQAKVDKLQAELNAQGG